MQVGTAEPTWLLSIAVSTYADPHTLEIHEVHTDAHPTNYMLGCSTENPREAGGGMEAIGVQCNAGAHVALERVPTDLHAFSTDHQETSPWPLGVQST